MKKIAALLLLFQFAAVSSHAQSRPRRVGQSGDPSSRAQTQRPTQTTTAQTQPTASTPAPGAPPRIGGAVNSGDSPSSGARAEQPAGPVEIDEGEVISVNTTLVSIPVSVMDRQGKYVPDLRKEDFRVYEDGVEQEVAYFATVEKPFTVALLLDTSGSTRFRLDEIQDAATAFVNQLRPADRVMIVSFDDQVRVLSEPTSDRYQLREAIRRTRPGEGTRLYDAIDLVLNQRFNRIEGRKAIVLFTDGVDTTSRRASYQSTVRDAEEAEALIYPVQYDTFEASGGVWNGGGYPGGGYPRGGGGRRGGGSVIDILGAILSGGGVSIGRGGGYPGGNGPVTCSGCTREEYERGDRYLGDLSRASGARRYRADTTSDLAGAFSLVAEELRRQYSLGYYPRRPAQAGERRRIKVRVARPDLAVQARDSYVFGQASAPNTAARQSDDRQQRTRPTVQRQPFNPVLQEN